MADLATTVHAFLQRATKSVLDDVATDGLKVLRQVIHDAGFDKSEYLKNYELYAHVGRDSVTFEIVLDIEAVLPEDEATKKAMEQQQLEAEQAEEKAAKTYHLSLKTQNVRMLKDKRVPAKDKRKPARDVRKNAQDRLVEHELARFAPRSARVTRSGKLSVALRRSVRETEQEVVFPQGKFDGIVQKFLDNLERVVLEKFVPKLRELVQRYAV